MHFTTVSMALRGHPGLPETTRKRIRELADRMGYVRNPIYSALTRRRNGNRLESTISRLAYLANRSPELGFDALPHHRYLLKGAREQAQALGYELDLLFVAEDHYNSDSLKDYLDERDIQGIIIAAFEPGFSELILDWERYAVVKIDSQHMPPAASPVTNDQEQVVRMAFRRLRGYGYRRIGLAVGRAAEDATNHNHSSGLLFEQVLIPEEERIPPLLFPYNAKTEDVTG